MKKIIAFIFSILLVLPFCGCSGNEENYDYYVYYMSASGDELVSAGVNTDITDTDELYEFLLNEMLNAPDENKTSVLNSENAVISYTIADGVLNVYFSKSYSDITKKNEAFFRAAFVKTMIQISEIEYVRFYVDDRPLTDSKGEEVGLMNESSFITGKQDESVEWNNINLYFSDASGEMLICENTYIAYNRNTPIEKAIIENLMENPEQSDAKSPLPGNLKIISIQTKEGVCYVNLDSTFLSDIADVSAKVTIYAIVDSLCELSTVNRVQFLINGSSDYEFRNVFSLKDSFERNLDIIKKEE